MAEHALPLHSRDPEPGGIWPWILALVAAGALVLAVGERLASVPASLERQVRELARAAGAENIDIAVDGRDVTLSGELAPSVERDAFARRVADVNGARIVRDELVVVDPAARARASREAFRRALETIDVADVAFAPGSASFVRGGDDALAALVQLMGERPEYRIRVAGHTDSRGRSEVNLALSRERADAVAAYLVARGVDPGRIVAQGYGSTQPVADNATEDGRTRNRRIEISYID